MSLTQKLIGYLNRVFDKDPQKVLALRLRYSGPSMTWQVANGVLTTSVAGGPGVGLRVDLAEHTIASLCSYLAQQPGYSVAYQDTSTFSGRSALVLLDGAGDQDQSNGDHFYGYTSVLWSYMSAVANELALIRAAINEALLQMAANTASGEWVDEHGSYYNVPRKPSETDSAYASRIVTEVIKARGNNVAIGGAIRETLGADSVDVEDVGTTQTAADGTKSYGLFDVTVQADVNTPIKLGEGDVAIQIIEIMRDAGTHLRTLKYIRKSGLVLYAGAAVRAGIQSTVRYRTLLLDGTWVLDGAYNLDGFRD